MHGRDQDGYGHYWFNRKTIRAHRVSYQLYVGPIPSGMFVCHKCDTPPCVNPDHLFLGTQVDNATDRQAKGRGSKLRGEACPYARLTADDVRVIRFAYACGGATQAGLGKCWGISRSSIEKITLRKMWNHGIGGDDVGNGDMDYPPPGANNNGK
jgi:hypothetical protein